MKPNISSKISEQPRWFQIEFDDKEEFSVYYTSVLSQFSSYATYVAGKFPEISMRYLAGELGSFAGDEGSGTVNLTTRSKYQLINSFLQNISSALATRILVDNDANLHQFAFEIARFIFGWMPQHLELFAFKIRVIFNFFPVIQLFSQQVDISREIYQCFSVFLSMLGVSVQVKRVDGNDKYLDEISSSFVDLFQASISCFTNKDFVMNVVKEVSLVFS